MENVKLLLVDDACCRFSSELREKMEVQRFRNQSKGMKKYLENRMAYMMEDDYKPTLPIEFYNDRDVLLRVLGRIGHIQWSYLPKSLRTDREFVLEATKHKIRLDDWISKELLKDFEIVLEMVRYNHDIIDYVPSSITKDREKVKLLVQANGKILDSLFQYDNDREIGILSVRNGGPIPLRFLHDKEFLGEYSKANPPVEKPSKLFENIQALSRDRLIEVLKGNGKLITTLNLVGDRELVLVACNSGYAIQSNSPFISDREVVLASLSNNPYLINFLSEELKQDTDILMACLKSYSECPPLP